MAIRVSVEDAADRLLELVDTALRGEDVFLTIEGKDVVRLVPIRQSGSSFEQEEAGAK